MSRQLPLHPNLDHLKKQAKALLRELQQQDPAAQLSDAQHALARQYGFRNWSKLKAHVESVHSPEPAAAPRTPAEPSPFVGTWTANVSKSKPHPLNQFRRATLEVEVVGDSVTLADVVVDDRGREEQSKNTLRADGKEYPTPRGYVVCARWDGSRVLEALVTKDDRMEGRVRYEVAVDGRTLTLSTDDQSAVFDRA